MFKKLAVGLISLLIAALPVLANTKVSAADVNLYSNPSVETSADSTTPDGWQTYTSGTGTTFTYDNAGHTGSRSVSVKSTGAGNGDWFSYVPVTAGQNYKFSVWYKSTADTQINVDLMDAAGTSTYGAYLGNVPASADWTQYTTYYTVPAGATQAAFYQTFNPGVAGELTTDDYSVSAYTPVGFTHPMVSVTFDDGWANQYTNARPVMQSNGLVGTYYIISGELNDSPDYMSTQQVKDLYGDGNEIGSHTVHHCDLTGAQNTDDKQNCKLSSDPNFATAVHDEMFNSKSTLEQTVTNGTPVTNFAYPYGAYNASSITVGQQAGYASQRTVDRGYNTKDNLDVTKLKMYEVDSDITTEQVKAWIDGAKAENAWLILTYHEIADVPSEPDDALYTVKPADFQAQMAYLKSSGIVVETVAQALADINGQVVIPPVTKPGDVNGDNVIDALDLSTVLSNWNLTAATKAQGDLNADGTVDALDLSTVLANWSI